MLARAGVALFMLAAVALSVASQGARAASAPVVLGLDHIVVAVANLEATTEQFRRLGFVLKPGMPHANGIQNQHVKFRDGTEIELLSVGEARDALTREYLSHLETGDGPAFVAWFAPDLNALAARLDAANHVYRRDGGRITFNPSDHLRYQFFGGRNHSPTDRPEHFEHSNGAQALIGVWLAGDALAAEQVLLAELGMTLAQQQAYVPEPASAIVGKFEQAEVVCLPGSRQTVHGRKIIGATLRTHDLSALRHALASTTIDVPSVVETSRGRSMFVPPDQTHGIWFEFREEQEPDSAAHRSQARDPKSRSSAQPLAAAGKPLPRPAAPPVAAAGDSPPHAAAPPASASGDSPPQAPRRTQLSDDLIVERIGETLWRHISFQELEEFGRVPANGLIVRAGNDGVLIDTPWTPEETSALMDWVSDSLGFKIKTVIATHYHADCLGGLAVAHKRGARSYSLDRTKRLARKNRMASPKKTFRDSLKLAIGGETFSLAHVGGGHTPDNIVVWLETEQVLFGGCLVRAENAKTLGYTGEAVLDEWPVSIERLIARYSHAQLIIPGHGDPGGVELLHHTLELLQTAAEGSSP